MLFGVLVAYNILRANGEPCSFQANQDYSQGEGGPSSPAASSADCCAQCVAAGPDVCFAAVFDVATGGVCWFKTKAQTAKPTWSPNLIACWPGSAPSPQPPPPPPPPPLYSVVVVSLPADPVLSFIAGNTAWPQSFNPSFVEASTGTRGVRGLLVRSQNCSFSPGKCISCNPRGPNDNPFLGSVITFAAQNADGSFQRPYLVFAPEGSHDEKGTEDPRIKYDKTTGLYHMFYTCYGDGGGLCHATTTDPTAPSPGLWTRHGVMWSGKSAALLLRDAPPHYLYQGDSNIQLWTTDDLFNYTLLTSKFITPRGDHFDSDLVESGPPPLLLEDGNYLFLHNSANTSAGHCYHPGYVVLSGADPSVILQRSEVPLLSPTRDWELGDAPAECNVQCVVFLEAAAPVDGQPNTFDVWFGGSDAVVGTARLFVAKL